MAREFYIHGQALVQLAYMTVSGSTVTVGEYADLGLTDDSIIIRPNYSHMEIQVDSAGTIPGDIQIMGTTLNIDMTLVHFEAEKVDEAMRYAMGGQQTGYDFSMAAAGKLLGANNFLYQMRVTSPVKQKPWLFRGCYLTGQPLQWPIGVKRSLVALSWKTFPFLADPYGTGGITNGIPAYPGHQGTPVWNRGG
jgi:hypothetical protein